jgi:phosphonate transport system substrate-binding protein
MVIRTCVLAFLACIALSAYAQPESQKQELQFGSVAMDIPAIMHKRLTPLTQYLGEKLGRNVALKLSPNMGAAIHGVASGNVDIAYLTPVAYLNARKRGEVQLIAKTITNGKGSFQLMIVVKDDSPIQTVEQLKGKSFAFGDEKALLQRATVVGAGAELEAFSEYKFLGHYDNIARAVLVGDFDAGILKDTTAFKWQNQGLRILYSSPDLPPYNIAASRNVDGKTLQQLKDAFLALDPDNKEDLAIIKSLDKKYDGFAATSDAEYDVVRKLVAPFQK